MLVQRRLRGSPIIVASNPVLLQPLNQHQKSYGYGVFKMAELYVKHRFGEASKKKKQKEKRKDKWVKELIGNLEIRKLKYI